MRYVAVLFLWLGQALGAAPPPAALTATAPPPDAVWLESLGVASMTAGWGSPQAGRSSEGNPLRLGGTTYPHGIGTHAVSDYAVDLHGSASRLVVMVGVDDEANGQGSVAFEVLVDGKSAVRTPVLRVGGGQLLDVPLTAARRLVLRVTDGGDGLAFDHADWAGALLYLLPGAKERPECVRTVADLLSAASRGDLAAVREWLARGLDVNATGPDGATALHRAVQAGQTAMVRLLLEHHAQVNAKAAFGLTPLHEALARGRDQEATLLLAAGADPNALDAAGRKPTRPAQPAAQVTPVRCGIDQSGDSAVVLWMELAAPPLADPAPGRTNTYIWFVDTDGRRETGQPHGAVGSEYNVRALVGGDAGIAGYLDGIDRPGGSAAAYLDGTRVAVRLSLAQLGRPTRLSCTGGTSGWAARGGELTAPVSLAVSPTAGVKLPAAGQWFHATVQDLGIPFDPAYHDGSGPGNTYAKTPEVITAVAPGGQLEVAWREQDSGRLFLSQLVGGEARQHLLIGGLEQLTGFTIDPFGNRYVLTTLREDIARQAEPSHVQRAGVVQLAKIDRAGRVVYRAEIKGKGPIYLPMYASSGRLAYGNGELALTFGQASELDKSINCRHQFQVYVVLDAATGREIAWYGGPSHSLDQRLMCDSDGFIGLELGDAYPRAIAVSRLAPRQSRQIAFAIKYDGPKTGGNSYNEVFTKLGNLVPVPGGYGLLFATETSTAVDHGLNGSRNLAYVRIPKGFEAASGAGYEVRITDRSLGTDFVVPAGFVGSQTTATNRGVVWLTHYTDAELEHAERPRLVALQPDRLVALWEQWTRTRWVATYALLLDGRGKVLAGPQALPGARLSRGDDVVAVGGRAVWVTGDLPAACLKRYSVGEDLQLVCERLR